MINALPDFISCLSSSLGKLRSSAKVSFLETSLAELAQGLVAMAFAGAWLYLKSSSLASPL